MNVISAIDFNLFSSNVPLLYPLKTSETPPPRFSDVFRKYRSGTLVENGLILPQGVMDA